MVISSSHAYAAFCAPYVDATTRSDAFGQWGAAQGITRATSPMVRGTRSMGGGLIPLRNARHIIDARVPDAVAPLPQGDVEWLAAPSVLAQGVSLGKATDAAPAHTLCADILSGHGCAHVAVMDESGVQAGCSATPVRTPVLSAFERRSDGLEINDLNGLASFFAHSAGTMIISRYGMESLREYSL